MPKFEIPKDSLKYIEDRLEERIPIRGEKDVEYVKERFFWIVDKFKKEFYENGNQLETDSILDKIFILLDEDDWGVNDFDRLIIGIGFLMNVIINKMGGKLKVSEDFLISQFNNMVKLRWILQTSFVRHHLNFFATTLMKAGIEVSEIPALIEKSMEWAETNPDYDYTNDQYLDDLTNEMVRLSHEKGKSISQRRLEPPIE